MAVDVSIFSLPNDRITRSGTIETELYSNVTLPMYQVIQWSPKAAGHHGNMAIEHYFPVSNLQISL